MLEIDGSYGEGGGQILRTALALSCVAGTPFRIAHIRQGRKKPGLMPQHLASVRSAQAISGATVAGADPGSSTLTFTPGAVRGGTFEFRIGTAGSVTLVLQTLILPLLFADRPSRVILEGGTHVPWSPSFHYLAEVFAPLLRTLGGELRLTVRRYGFYPRGGGEVCAEIDPTRGLGPLTLVDLGRLRRIDGISAVANLPLDIAARQRDAALDRLADCPGGRLPPAGIELLEAAAPSPGTFLFLRTETDAVRSGFTALGARGKRAETVGAEAAQELCAHLATGACLDPHLADQVVPYLALAPQASSFTTSRITRHLLTNLQVTGLFRPLRYEIAGNEGEPGRISLFPGTTRGH